VTESLSADSLRPGQTLPDVFGGRASFALRPLSTNLASPGVLATVRGPSGAQLWAQHVGPWWKEDAVFAGDGLGEYALCFAYPPSPVPPMPSLHTGPVSVDFLFLFPYEGAIDPSLLEQPSGEWAPGEVPAAADDIAVAANLVTRLQADARRLAGDQAALAARQERHFETVRSSERRVAVWSGLEAGCLAVLAGMQYFYLRRSFRNYG
jgi:hypothetical protein